MTIAEEYQVNNVYLTSMSKKYFPKASEAKQTSFVRFSVMSQIKMLPDKQAYPVIPSRLYVFNLVCAFKDHYNFVDH